MPVPTSIADLSTTAASNYPAGSDAIGTSLDDYLRTIQAIIKRESSKGSDITAATTIDVPNDGSYFVVTGNTTIAGISDDWVGRTVVLKFSGTPQITHSASFILPGSANITAAAGDMMIVANESTGVWRCVAYQYASGVVKLGAVTSSGLTQSTARLLGRTTASTGAVEELTVSEGIQMGSGTVKADVNGLTEDTTPDTANDFALVWDASASAHKKVKLNKIGASIGQQMVRLNTANGYGSTNIKIRRFTNTVTNTGSDITYADSATNGASFTINTSGVYSISYSDVFTTGADMGLSLNTTAPTTNIGSIPIAEILVVVGTSASGFAGEAAWTGYLASGSVVRAHDSGGVSASAAYQQFTIVRVA